MKIKFLLFGTILLALFWALQANAETCNFTRQIADLKTTTSTDAELTLRQNLLYGIIDCLSSSTQILKSAYDSLPYVQNGLNLKTRFQNEVNGNLFYYGEKEKEVGGAGIPQTKLMAKEILDWKQSHEEDMARASYFLLWFKNQNLLTLAHGRSDAISTLKLNSGNQSNLIQAQSVLAAADSLNSSAQASFEQNVKPSDSLALIKQSLQSMLSAYKFFMKIGGQQ